VENPYQSPAQIAPDTSECVRKAIGFVRDSRLALAVGAMPLLGLVYIVWLIQWYALRGKLAELDSGTAGKHAQLLRQFHAAQRRLWVAVILWPALIGVFVLYFAVA
jgi:hypothetical protein